MSEQLNWDNSEHWIEKLNCHDCGTTANLVTPVAYLWNYPDKSKDMRVCKDCYENLEYWDY